jgi:DNA-binding transcriptional regulator YiaG
MTRPAKEAEIRAHEGAAKGPMRPARFPWAGDKRRPEKQASQTVIAPHLTWEIVSGKALDGIRIALGLTEPELAKLLGMKLPTLQNLQAGDGKIIGPAVKLLALLRAMEPEQRKAAVAFMLSSRYPGTLRQLETPKN